LDDTEHDIERMRRVAQGDAAAYRELSERHLQPILRYATRLLRDPTEAEDVTQETFLKLWTTADTWTPSAKPSTWLHRIAHNACVDRLRRRQTAAISSEAAVEAAQASDRPSDLLARKQTTATIEHALSQLPERQRAALLLVHHQGMTNIEAAEVLGVGVDALESLLARGRRSLREALAALNPAESTP
jgi:RNA polymerase sigma-70 factor (ECF subfamily)